MFATVYELVYYLESISEKADIALAFVLTAIDKDKSEVRNSTKTLCIHIDLGTHPLLMPCSVFISVYWVTHKPSAILNNKNTATTKKTTEA